jgi:hypothetical protein
MAINLSPAVHALAVNGLRATEFVVNDEKAIATLSPCSLKLPEIVKLRFLVQTSLQGFCLTITCFWRSSVRQLPIGLEPAARRFSE